MAITPEQAAARNDEDSKRRLEEAEKELDAKLRKGFRSGNSVTISKLPLGDDHWLRKKLLARYRAAGWEISSGYDQRDNSSWMTFKAAQKPSASYANQIANSAPPPWR